MVFNRNVNSHTINTHISVHMACEKQKETKKNLLLNHKTFGSEVLAVCSEKWHFHKNFTHRIRCYTIASSEGAAPAPDIDKEWAHQLKWIFSSEVLSADIIASFRLFYFIDAISHRSPIHNALCIKYFRFSLHNIILLFFIILAMMLSLSALAPRTYQNAKQNEWQRKIATHKCHS